MSTVAPDSAAPDSAGLEELIRAAAALAAQAAAETDRDGTQAETALERFGALGALRLGIEEGGLTVHGPSENGAAAETGTAGSALGGYARLLEAVAGECMSSAFSLWAHRMVVEYLRASGGFDDVVEELIAGTRAGSIAMATAMQELSGVGAVPTVAVRDGDGYRVTGRIAWASNIAPGTVIVFPARVESAGGETSDAAGGSVGVADRVILTATVGTEGLVTREAQDLLALGATRSAMLQFDGVYVGPEGLVADSFDACRARRSAHLLLQSAFCAGLARRSLAEASAQLEGPGGVLAAQHARLAAQLDDLGSTLHAYVDDIDAVHPRDVTVLRYQIARLAGAAARHESTLIGGRGYVTTTATNRRLREASFLPVQSPSEVQLLQELERFGVHPTEGYSI